MDDVQCDGLETDLAQCDFRGWGTEDCRDFEAAKVMCLGK